MKFITAAFFLTVTVFSSRVSAQVSEVTIRPHLSGSVSAGNSPLLVGKHVTAANAPVLGYVMGEGPSEILPVFATATGARLGEALTVPAEVAKVFLPPSQRYCLLELSSGAALAVWDLHREFTNGIAQEPISIASAIDHPDVLSFSPRGEAVALYSEGPGILQILTHLPAQPRVSSQLSTAQFGKLSRLAISDDGQILVAGFSDGTFEVHTSERGWQPLQIGYKPEAWSFLPNSHDLVISDVVLKAVVIQPRIEDSAKPLRVLAQDIQVDELAISRSGGAIVAANKTSGHVWNIDLQTETATLDEVLSGKGKLAALRDGFTFVITNPPSLSVVRVNAASLSTESKN